LQVVNILQWNTLLLLTSSILKCSSLQLNIKYSIKQTIQQSIYLTLKSTFKYTLK
jgi:hypothetical protein